MPQPTPADSMNDVARAALVHTVVLAEGNLKFAQRRYADARRRLAEFDADQAAVPLPGMSA